MSSKAEAEPKSQKSPDFKSSVKPATDSRIFIQRKCACSSSLNNSECDECAGKSLPLQRRSAGPATTHTIPSVVHDVLASPGHPLDSPTRSFMESRFGHDFGSVRLHTDARAAESAQAVDAHAYTVGQNIVFGSGQYNPHSTEGRHLLAHELTHTIQQKGLQRYSASDPLHDGDEYHRLEKEADAVATLVTSGQPAQIRESSPVNVLSRAKIGASSAVSSQPDNPDEDNFEELEDNSGNSNVKHFKVLKSFPLPNKKGKKAEAIWKNVANNRQLQAVFKLSDLSKVDLKESRDNTDTLKESWLSKVGWSGLSKDDLKKQWTSVSGSKQDFPKVNGLTCHMDHIIELQVGGTNIKENVQLLDGNLNTSSGSNIKTYIGKKAYTLKGSKLNPTAELVVLEWHDVALDGPAECGPCCQIEQKINAVNDVGKSSEDNPNAKAIPIKIKALSTTIYVEGKNLTQLAESEIPENRSAAQIVPGLSLKEYNPVEQKITAKFDTQSRIPTSFKLTDNEKTSGIEFKRSKNGELSLATKNPNLQAIYTGLSPAGVTFIDIDDSNNLNWKGFIKPTIPFLGQLDVAYSNGELKVYKGLDEGAIKNKSFTGARITKAEVGILLSPEFKPYGRLEFEIGKNLINGDLNLSNDDVGLVAEGNLTAKIPKMETAQSKITYKGGADRNLWDASLNIKPENIKVGSSVSISGGFVGKIDKDGVSFDGKINAALPGNNQAELQLTKVKDEWILTGTGTFNIPNLDPVQLRVTYDLNRDILNAEGATGFTIPGINLKGNLNKVTVTIQNDGKPKVTGQGGLSYRSKNGKAEGKVNVALNPNGKFTGEGDLAYRVKENLTVRGKVILDEKQKLIVDGELEVSRYELFKKYEKKRELIDPPFNIKVPVPGASIGTTGLVFLIQGGVGASVSFGPGAIEPLKLGARFNPLENDTDFKATLDAKAKIPVDATLSSWISGSLAIQIDVGVGSAGVDGGLKLNGDLRLTGGAFAKLDATYEKNRLKAKMDAGMETRLLLGLALSAFARAWAGAFGVQREAKKEWELARKTIDTGVNFSLSAPFEYDSESGMKLPDAKDITLKKPEIDIQRLVDQIFKETPVKSS